MKVAIIIFMIFFATILGIMCIIGMVKGINLKKRMDWLFILSGFFLGYLIGLTTGELSSAIGGAVGGAILVGYTGEMSRRHRELFKPPDKPSRKHKN